jgi:hypothetical protein
MGVSERRTCAVLGQHRSTQRKLPRGRDDEERLTADIIELGAVAKVVGNRVGRLRRDDGTALSSKVNAALGGLLAQALPAIDHPHADLA